MGTFFLVLAFNGFAQDSPPEYCPTISVSGPSSPVPLGKTATFTLKLDERASSYSLTFVWSVSIGRIISGQGTRTLTVLNDEDAGRNLTATARIEGLPEGCPHQDSETVPPYDPPEPILADEFIGSPLDVPIERFIELAKSMENSPTSMMFVSISGNGKNSVRSIKKKKELFLQRLKLAAGVHLDRLTIVESEGNDDLTRVFIVPAGARPPNF